MQGSDRKVPHRTECIFTDRTVVYEIVCREDKKPLCFDRNGICCRRLSASVQGRSQMAE